MTLQFNLSRRSSGPSQGPLAALTDLRFAGALFFAGAAAMVAVNFAEVPVIARTVGGGIRTVVGDVAGGVEHIFVSSPPAAPAVKAPVSHPGSARGSGFYSGPGGTSVHAHSPRTAPAGAPTGPVQTATPAKATSSSASSGTTRSTARPARQDGGYAPYTAPAPGATTAPGPSAPAGQTSQPPAPKPAPAQTDPTQAQQPAPPAPQPSDQPAPAPPKPQSSDQPPPPPPKP